MYDQTTERDRRDHAERASCNCALLCDEVLVSQAKGKHILHGIIGTIGVPEFPATIGGYVTYVRISNVLHAQKIRIALEDAATEEPIFAFEAAVPKPDDPFGMYLFMLPVPPFRVERGGQYLFMARADGVPLAYSPITIVGPAEPPAGEGDPA